MRLKIILPNALIMLLVGVLSWFVVRQKLMATDDPGPVKTAVERGAAGAAGVVQLQLLRGERWLADEGLSGPSAAPIIDRLAHIENSTGRKDPATAALDALKRRARDAFPNNQPDLAAIVDKDGKARGRSDTNQGYDGDDFGAQYPALMKALGKAKPGAAPADQPPPESGSDVWLATQFNHKLLVSFAPVRDGQNQVIGAVILGWTLSNKSVADTADGATAVVVLEGKEPKVKAANEADVTGFSGQLEGAFKATVTQALEQGSASTASGDLVVGVSALRSIGDGKSAVIAVGRRISGMSDRADGIVWPILAAAALGLVFVLIAGALLGSYVTDPIGRIEETLLQVINGNTNQRVQIEHAELGGLAFRINQLLNTVLGVEEDTTDDEGRPSAPPAPNHFQEAMSVDERTTDAGAAAALAAEPESSYYARLYREYIEAKQANGEKVDGITQEVFVAKIQGMERDQTAKVGRAVRYAVQRRDKQVVLLAVPLS